MKLFDNVVQALRPTSRCINKTAQVRSKFLLLLILPNPPPRRDITSPIVTLHSLLSRLDRLFQEGIRQRRAHPVPQLSSPHKRNMVQSSSPKIPIGVDQWWILPKTHRIKSELTPVMQSNPSNGLDFPSVHTPVRFMSNTLSSPVLLATSSIRRALASSKSPVLNIVVFAVWPISVSAEHARTSGPKPKCVRCCWHSRIHRKTRRSSTRQQNT